MLNAFRHQRMVHIQRLAPPSQPERVLNAFRHQRMVHGLAFGPRYEPRKCSTPFGIRGWCTCGCETTGPTVRKCSTPFGIRGWCTLPNPFMVSLPNRAQRLSASEDGALGLPPYWPDNSASCSTPFGIRGWCTRARAGHHRRAHVLNAFRHQRMVHSPSGAGWRSTCSAQRLSASEDGAPRAGCRRPARPRRAQRLSASEDGALERLKAELAQRDGMCSTPFGIRGWCTGDGGGGGGGVWVLNAFRHQRMVHGHRRGTRATAD